MTQEHTPLDAAHAAMQEAPGDDAARLRYYERLAESELFLLLEEEAEGDDIRPRHFDTAEGRFVLAFDRELRLADFAGAAPYVALSGRVLAGMLAGTGTGIGVNLSVEDRAFLVPGEAVDWLAQTLAHAPAEATGKPEELRAPTGLPERLLTALDAKLALAGGLARWAWLAEVTWAGGRRGHLLAFVDILPGAEAALARLAGEALTFSGLDAGELDVAFFAASDPVAARLARVALRFDLPEPPRMAPADAPAAPGSDPDRPPRLR